MSQAIVLYETYRQLEIRCKQLEEENTKLKSIIASYTETAEFKEDSFLQQQIDRSTINRFNWKSVFHKSLSKVVADCFARGLNAEAAYSEISEKLKEAGAANSELLRRLRIGCHARMGEMHSELTQAKTTRKRIGTL